MVGVMFLTGWWTMAILTMFLLSTKHAGMLDNVTPLSRGRKIMSLLIIGIFISCLTFSPVG